MIVLSINDIYETNKNGTAIAMVLTIANQQEGEVIVRLGTQEVLRSGENYITKELGVDSDLYMKALSITGVIKDVATTTNEIKVTLNVNGGRKHKEWVRSANVNRQGEVAHYIAEITFF